MRTLLFSLALVATGLLAGVVWAQEETPPGEVPLGGPEMRERMIEEFDADGDGQLSDDERQQAREAMRERRGERGGGPGRGPGRGFGPGGPPDPNALFDEFDADKDGQLSRDEFMKLTENMRQRRGRPGGPPQGPPPGPPGEGRPRRGGAGEGFGIDDRPGPPPEQGEFDRPGPPEFRRRPPLQNPGDAGPPPEGPGFGPRAGGGGGGGGAGMGPDPNRMFDRFDANGDDQLSREEFMSLTETLRGMRERISGRGPQRGGPPGGGFGRPNRGGPGGPGGERPRRPAADIESDLDAPASESPPI